MDWSWLDSAVGLSAGIVGTHISFFIADRIENPRRFRCKEDGCNFVMKGSDGTVFNTIKDNHIQNHG